MAKEQKSKLSALLEKLQEESWQLELIISGFAIFLVAASFENIQGLIRQVDVYAAGLENSGILKTPVVTLIAAWFFLLINLIIHVILRGFWIAAIGLRYVSGDVDFEALKFTAKFDRHLRKRVPPFDLFIERLEKICSVVFAFTFIIIFMVISVAMFFAFTSLLTYLIDFAFENSENVRNLAMVKLIVVIFIFLCAFIYFIDFVTLGWVKRIKWFSVIYYPIYRVMSLITLSFLYRPLYYNLIDDSFGRKVGYLLVPYVLIFATIASAEIEAFKYFPREFSKEKIRNTHYLDMLEEKENIERTIIPSKFISNSFLEVFIPYDENDDDEIEKLCPGLHSNNKMGIRLNIVQINVNDAISPSDSLLDCVSQIYKIYINDSLTISKPFFYEHPNMNEPGLLHIIDISHLPRGPQDLKVEQARYLRQQDSISYRVNATIPFWTH